MDEENESTVVNTIDKEEGILTVFMHL